MRNDEKVLAARRKFGFEGYSVWVMCLEKLYGGDNFEFRLKTETDWELLSGDFLIEPEKLKEIINYYVLIDLLQKKAYTYYSKEVNRRVQPILDERERGREYVNRRWKPSETEVIGADNASNKELSVSETIQSKVKESKVKKEECVSSLMEIEGIKTGENYQADGFSPRDRLLMKRRLEKSLGMKKSSKWQTFIFGTARDFLTAFKKYQGYQYPDNVLLDEVSKTLAKWYELGETRETVREMLIAFFEGKKSDAVTVTPNSVFSSHTYNSWKQNKL